MELEDIMAAFGTIVMVALIIIVVCLASPTLVSEEKVEVTATITDTHHSFAMGGPYVYRAADYDIYFEYDGIKGSWDVNSEIYEKYKDKVGESIKCYLITSVYENGKAELKLVAVDDYEERR